MRMYIMFMFMFMFMYETQRGNLHAPGGSAQAAWGASFDALIDALLRLALFPGHATCLLAGPAAAPLLGPPSPAGLPAHELRLKKNMPIMLLRNLSPAEGLCNGTRLLVKRVVNGRMLEATIVTGSHADKVVLIPRIKLSPDEDLFGFEWSRLQFPVRIAFAMTINKAQGQTLSRVGVFLERQCFSQARAAVRRDLARRAARAHPLRASGANGEYRAANIVYREALTRV